jgi:prepilin-type N-terminal cleavage/methylation domain-containing protein
MVTRHRPGLRSPRRGGFTLVELIVVIAIIVLLVSLTVGATVYFMNTAQETHAQATLKKLDTGLLQQWKAAIDTAQDEWRSGSNAAFPPSAPRATVLAAAGNDPAKGQQLWTALRLAQEFPTSYKEAQSGTPQISGVSLPPKHAYQVLFGNNVSGPEESSACLLAALSQGRRGMVFNVEDAVGVSSIRTIPGSNGGQVRVLVDIYGTPLGFTRGNTPGAPPWTWQPEILSAGKDQNWGTGDDISSVRLRTTGQRGD